jgi:hypothetical protein
VESPPIGIATFSRLRQDQALPGRPSSFRGSREARARGGWDWDERRLLLKVFDGLSEALGADRPCPGLPQPLADIMVVSENADPADRPRNRTQTSSSNSIGSHALPAIDTFEGYAEQ